MACLLFAVSTYVTKAAELHLNEGNRANVFPLLVNVYALFLAFYTL